MRTHPDLGTLHVESPSYFYSRFINLCYHHQTLSSTSICLININAYQTIILVIVCLMPRVDCYSGGSFIWWHSSSVGEVIDNVNIQPFAQYHWLGLSRVICRFALLQLRHDIINSSFINYSMFENKLKLKSDNTLEIKNQVDIIK